MHTMMIYSHASGGDGLKAKNIQQTEIMIRLRDAILRVSRYFQAADPTYNSSETTTTSAVTPTTPPPADTAMVADYSMDSHAKDHEAYMSMSKSKRKRARAITDFERRDDDELGKDEDSKDMKYQVLSQNEIRHLFMFFMKVIKKLQKLD